MSSCYVIFTVFISLTRVYDVFCGTNVNFIAKGPSVLKNRSKVTPHSHEIKILAGDQLDLTCSSKGLQDPTITWFKDGVQIASLEDGKVEGNSLQLTGIKDEGNYTCIARSDVGELSAFAQIKHTECPEEFNGNLVFATPSGCSMSTLQKSLSFVENITTGIEEEFARSKMKLSLVPVQCPNYPTLGSNVFRDKALLLDSIVDFEQTRIPLKDTLKYIYTESFTSKEIETDFDAITKVAVVIVDYIGEDTEDAVWEASMLKFLHGVELFVVGVGPDVTPEDLERLASHPIRHHMFHVTDYDHLHLAVMKVVHGLCI